MDRSVDAEDANIAEIVRRIVRAAALERSILFGSAARGEAGLHSDLDLLVIKAGNYHRRDMAGDIRMALIDVPHAIDVIVVTPEAVERYRNSFALVIAPALREGRELYAA